MDQEVAKLWLNTGSLTTTQSQTGITSANFMSQTFNFDLRLVLGETLWTKYKFFKMYINDTFQTATLSMATLYQDGLPLVNASYQGLKAGYLTAIDEYNLAQNVNIQANQGRPSNTRTFMMIKPDTNNVQLTLQYISENGATATVTRRTWFLCFVPYIENIYKNPYNMLYTFEQVNFTLSTVILTAGSSNQYGTCNTNRTIYTFSNVNMRQILGTLYEKYEKFNLIVNTMGYSAAAQPSTATNRRMWVEIDGLQFVNTLRVTTGYKQGSAFSPCWFINAANQSDAQTNDPPMSITTFRKPESENVDLTFTVWASTNGGELMTVGPLGQQVFTFSVVGVK